MLEGVIVGEDLRVKVDLIVSGSELLSSDNLKGWNRHKRADLLKNQG